MMKLRTHEKKLLRDLFLSLVNRTSIKLLEHVDAEQQRKIDLLIGNPAFGSWRIQQTDDALRSLEKILGMRSPAKGKKKKKKTLKGKVNGHTIEVFQPDNDN